MPGRDLIPRTLITLLGIVLILMGMSEIFLGFAGERADAVVTDIRREGGERTDGRPGRYTYNIGYTFTLADGRAINGVAKKIGNAVYLKANGQQTVPIRYFRDFPYISTMEKDDGSGAGQLTLIIAGGALVFLMNTKKQKDDQI
ncbi:MAG TPA: hypothetical protein VEA58_13320 [Anaerovoracaceae bacterium]|nr:hypothetical protein [Anaerovoracaceae bacterium]